MAFRSIGSLPQGAFKPHHIDGVPWKLAMVSLTKTNDSPTKYVQKVQFDILFEIKIEIERQCQSNPKLIGYQQC